MASAALWPTAARSASASTGCRPTRASARALPPQQRVLLPKRAAAGVVEAALQMNLCRALLASV